MDVCNGIHQIDSPNSAAAGLCFRPVLLSRGVLPSVPCEYNLWEAAAYLTSKVMRPLVAGISKGVGFLEILLLRVLSAEFADWLRSLEF